VKSLDAGVLNARGRIKVTATFQLESHPNIYAIGDVIDWSEQKQAAKAAKHADIAAANIVSQVNGGSANKKYTGQPELIIITNGKVSGCCLACLYSISDPPLPCHSETRRYLFGLLVGYHAGELVLQFNEGQRAFGWYDTEGIRSFQVK
jgi:NADPH-dependent 2,4-dienoyl-CoA reductase/sulfur reductase-like enzyme